LYSLFAFPITITQDALIDTARRCGFFQSTAACLVTAGGYCCSSRQQDHPNAFNTVAAAGWTHLLTAKPGSAGPRCYWLSRTTPISAAACSPTCITKTGGLWLCIPLDLQQWCLHMSVLVLASWGHLLLAALHVATHNSLYHYPWDVSLYHYPWDVSHLSLLVR